MALKEFRLPDIGEGIAEGEIVSWKVEVGQQVHEEDEFVEVMTDKATVMITVPFEGVIKELRYQEGDVVPVESVIAVIETGAAGGEQKPAAAAPPPAAAAPQGKPAPAKPAPAPAARPAPAPAARPAPGPAASAPRPAPSAPAPAPAPASARARGDDGGGFAQASPGTVLAAPATRKRARDMGVDLREVRGTGPRGRVTNEDLHEYLQSGQVGEHAAPAEAAPAEAAPAEAAPAEAAPAEAPPAEVPAPQKRAPAARPKVAVPSIGAEERTPFRGLRRKIAEAMTRSKSTAAHFTYVDDVNVTELVKLRKQAKDEFKEQGVNVTYLPFIMKAIVEAMKKYPTMNSSLDESTEELVVKRYYNFGIATDTDNGLIVPVVKDVDRKSIVELAQEIQELAKKTREGSISVDDLQGGTFTITNAGNIGGLFATPIINFPEVAILGVHAIKKTPVVSEDGRITVGDVMYLSVSIDHRIVDGATGAHWMNIVKDCLEHPQRLLLGRL
jgi:pyruvate dehydrogenase E2 component (dihydrolipoamide acetyltransferase)